MELLHDRYQIERPLGSGGAGTTWLAIDTRTGKTVTVKRLSTPLDPTTQGARERETQLLSQLNHPQIPAFIEAFSEPWRMQRYLHLVLDYVDGEPLDAAMARRRFDQREARALVEDLLEIVAWMHRLAPPVIHRDIKPSNVILRSDGRVVLIDFGLATDAIDRTFLHTMAAGTVGYQAPEQIAGDPSPASDVYSVGVLALQLLTRTSPRELLSGQLLKWRGHAKHLEPRWQEWLDRALQPDPALRYADANEALDALRRAEPVPSRPIASVEPTPPARRRRAARSWASAFRMPLWLRPWAFFAGVVLLPAAVCVGQRALLSAPELATNSDPHNPEPSQPPPVPTSNSTAAANCRAGDNDACLRAAQNLAVPDASGVVPHSNQHLGAELLGLACTRRPASPEACVARAEREDDPTEALSWWAHACVLEADSACLQVPRAATAGNSERHASLLARLGRDCTALDEHPGQRELQASCALLYRWHQRGFGTPSSSDAATRVAAKVCPDHDGLSCLPSDLQPLSL